MSTNKPTPKPAVKKTGILVEPHGPKGGPESTALMGWEVKAPKRADMPLVSVLDKKPMRRSIELLEEGDAIKQAMEESKIRLDEIQKELGEIQINAGLPGMRYGSVVFVQTATAGKRTLNKELLIENGCAVEIIAKSYKMGAPGVKRELVNLERKKENKESEEGDEG